MDKEYWIPIKGYEGYYEISNFSRIKRLERTAVYTTGRKDRILPEMILKADGPAGYNTVSLNNGKNTRAFTVHRLVALHFIPNEFPDIRKEINHINKDITDYSIENLEWCTRSENIIHYYENKA